MAGKSLRFSRVSRARARGQIDRRSNPLGGNGRRKGIVRLYRVSGRFIPESRLRDFRTDHTARQADRNLAARITSSCGLTQAKAESAVPLEDVILPDRGGKGLALAGDNDEFFATCDTGVEQVALQ